MCVKYELNGKSMKRSYRLSPSPSPSAQQGVVLIVALVMLLMMTVAGVTTMSGATLQERIAGNQRQKMVSQNNADRALVAAETFMDTYHTGPSFNDAGLQGEFTSNGPAYAKGLYLTEANLGAGTIQSGPAVGFSQTTPNTWNNANSANVEVGGDVVGRYIVEYMGHGYFDSNPVGGRAYERNSGARRIFRITALGLSGNGNVVTIIESLYFEAAL